MKQQRPEAVDAIAMDLDHAFSVGGTDSEATRSEFTGARASVSRARRRVVSGLAVSAGLASLLWLSPSARADRQDPGRFRRVPTQFIAALGDPTASSGTGAEEWGIWRVDPGPRGVRLDDYARLEAADGVAPAQWQFDRRDWWLEEHGLIMEQPDFPLPPGQYIVTGDRDVPTVLTVTPADSSGVQR